jgi:hypothetical protein
MNVRITGAVLAVSLGVLLSACGGPENSKDGDDVASLVTVEPRQPTTSSAAPVSQERPLIRTDTSREEEKRLYDVWQACLEKNGAGTGKTRKAAAPGAPQAMSPNVDPAAEARSKEAEKKCGNQEPEEVWERSKRLDPAYADKLRDWVTCIRSHGIDAWESDGFLSFESLPPESQMKKVDECQDKAFGKG